MEPPYAERHVRWGERDYKSLLDFDAPSSDGDDDVEDMARVHEKRTQKRNRRNFGEMI